MSNPFNPLDWLRSAQDWFAKTERSSGFRPYLIFLLITAGVCFALLAAFNQVPGVHETSLVLLASSFALFMVLFGIKAFQDPDFCRSETHVRQMRKLELESMGSESNVFPGEVLEEEEELTELGVVQSGALPGSVRQARLIDGADESQQ